MRERESSSERKFPDAIKNAVEPIAVFVTRAARKDVKQIATFTAMLTPVNLHGWCTKRKPIMTVVSDFKIEASSLALPSSRYRHPLFNPKEAITSL